MIKKEDFMKNFKKSHLFYVLILAVLCIFAGKFCHANINTTYAASPEYSYSKYLDIYSFSDLTEQNVNDTAVVSCK